MAKEKTTPEERRQYIEEQRAADEAHIGPGRRLPVDMSFIDRSGNVVRPDRDSHYSKKKRLNDDYRAQPRYGLSIITILGLLGGLFFLSSNITGNVVGNMANSASNIVGVVLICVGLVGSFFWFKGREKPKNHKA